MVEKVYRGFRDLKVYQLSYALAMAIFNETKKFPVEERYLLTDQIRRSSRSIPANLAEAWKKRRYEKLFVSKLIDCGGEAAEVEVWLDLARDCGYLQVERHQYFLQKYEEVGKMLHSMVRQPEKFCF
jgi:four helix bundle protein